MEMKSTWTFPNLPCAYFPELLDCHGSWASVSHKCPPGALPHPLIVQISFNNPAVPFFGHQWSLMAVNSYPM